jgi:hypothetical protein
MSSVKVESILARCMLDPEFLDLLERDPQSALIDYALDPLVLSEFSRLDWKRVRGFSGMAAKVQNNGLWQHFFYSRTLLAYFKLDHALFIAYNSQHLENRRKTLSRDEQAACFLKFLKKHIDSLSDSYPGLCAIVQHEQWAWEIAKTMLGHDGPNSNLSTFKVRPTDRELLNSAMAINGVIRVGEFMHDPLDVMAMLERGQFDCKALAEGRMWRCYWGRPASRELHILESDAHSARFLEALDGRRSTKDILRSTEYLDWVQAKSFLRKALKIGLVVVISQATNS